MQSIDGRSNCTIDNVSLINYDYYMFWNKCRCACLPITDGPHPVIRVFGWTGDTGKRACVNIHGVYPYFYFRPETATDPTFITADAVSGFEKHSLNCRY
jgi:hypothetical protein